MPESIAEFAGLNAFPLSDSHWSYDTSELIKALDPGFCKGEEENEKAEKLSVAAINSLVLSGLVFLEFLGDDYDDETLIGTFVFSVTASILIGLTMK